ncbi:MAG: hypothetical protein HQ553_13385 [Chloroflexi bacterium]|nr:hypothetical protein [Chloroflexota bacterium]
MSEFQAKRIVCTVEEEIKAPLSMVFPLCCPVEELKWINGWEYQMVCSDSGVNEKGCIFIEEMSGSALFGVPVKTKWITTRHEPDTRIQFVLVSEEKSIIIFDLEFVDQGNGTCSARFQFIYTPMNEDAINETTEEKLMLIMTSLMSWLKYYCETGEMLK